MKQLSLVHVQVVISDENPLMCHDQCPFLLPDAGGYMCRLHSHVKLLEPKTRPTEQIMQAVRAYQCIMDNAIFAHNNKLTIFPPKRFRNER